MEEIKESATSNFLHDDVMKVRFGNSFSHEGYCSAEFHHKRSSKNVRSTSSTEKVIDALLGNPTHALIWIVRFSTPIWNSEGVTEIAHQDIAVSDR